MSVQIEAAGGTESLSDDCMIEDCLGTPALYALFPSMILHILRQSIVSLVMSLLQNFVILIVIDFQSIGEDGSLRGDCEIMV